MKSLFAAAPHSCHDEIPDAPMMMHSPMKNFTMASDKIMSRSKRL
jgi:hypothetical protein